MELGILPLCSSPHICSGCDIEQISFQCISLLNCPFNWPIEDESLDLVSQGFQDLGSDPDSKNKGSHHFLRQRLTVQSRLASNYVTQTGFNLPILLPQPSQCLDYRHAPVFLAHHLYLLKVSSSEDVLSDKSCYSCVPGNCCHRCL